MDKLDFSDIGNIDHVSENVILLWQKIIHCGSQPTENDTNIDMDYNHHKFNLLGHPGSWMGILEPIIGKIEMLREYLTKIKSSRLGNNLQAIILCDIIPNRLLFNCL